MQAFQPLFQWCPRRNQETRENWYGSQKTKTDRQGQSSCKEEKDKVTKSVEVLKTDADKLSIKAEERTNLDLLRKANSFRKTILEKEKVLKDLEDSIIKMEESKEDFK